MTIECLVQQKQTGIYAVTAKYEKAGQVEGQKTLTAVEVEINCLHERPDPATLEAAYNHIRDQISDQTGIDKSQINLTIVRK